MPNVESVNDLGSFNFIPAGLSNERAWYLFEHIIREKCDEDARDVTVMPEAAYADNIIKRHCWCA